MNLGQLIGELRMRAEAAEEAASHSGAQPAPAHRYRVDRRAQIIALARERGSIRCRDLVAAFGITQSNAGVMLLTMHRDGDLVRSGERMKYRYSVPA